MATEIQTPDPRKTVSKAGGSAQSSLSGVRLTDSSRLSPVAGARTVIPPGQPEKLTRQRGCVNQKYSKAHACLKPPLP